jgi:hypothetical protein
MAQTLTRRIVTRVVLPTALLLSLALVTAQQYAREAVGEQRRARLLDQAQLHAANLALALAAAPAPGDLSELPIDGADPEAAVGFGLLLDADGRVLVDGGVRGLTAEALARASADLPPGPDPGSCRPPRSGVARSPVPRHGLCARPRAFPSTRH